jgi:hypothetical protein
MNMNNLEGKMENTLASFFSESNHFCGTEKSLHALYCHHLLENGVNPRLISREYTLGKLRIDVVLLDEATTAAKPRVALEFKGGAYGNRNALVDTISQDGHCPDLDKLRPLAAAGVECWFVCVDMRELGVALDEAARAAVSRQATAQGIRFAYYCQGDAHFMVNRGEYLVTIPLPPQPMKAANSASSLSRGSWLEHFTSLANGLDASEDTYAALLYHALRKAQFGAGQVSLETYFNCASLDGSRMQLRPDLTVFLPEVAGRFNLYKNGDKRTPNDQQKITNLLSVFEIKGSTATARLSVKAFAAQLAADLGKLAHWKTTFSAAHPAGRAAGAAYTLIALDHGSRLKGAVLDWLQSQAASLGVELIHVEV